MTDTRDDTLRERLLNSCDCFRNKITNADEIVWFVKAELEGALSSAKEESSSLAFLCENQRVCKEEAQETVAAQAAELADLHGQCRGMEIRENAGIGIITEQTATIDEQARELERVRSAAVPWVESCSHENEMRLRDALVSVFCSAPTAQAKPQDEPLIIGGHHEGCDVFETAPDLGPSRKPCNCRSIMSELNCPADREGGGR